MAGEVVFFANRLTLKVTSGTTDHTLAALHGCEIIPQAEHIEEYGMDSIFREAVNKVKFKVDFKAKYAKFNPAVATWWMMEVWNPSSGTAGAVADTNTVKLFSATGLITDGADTPTKLQAEIADIYFPATPMVLAENQYVVLDLAGTGRLVTYTNPA
jgi:hypothetical protein